MTEDEMVGWHHRFNGHEFEQAPGVGEGQGSLACCSPWCCKESDMTEQLNKNNKGISVDPSMVCKWIYFQYVYVDSNSGAQPWVCVTICCG